MASSFQVNMGTVVGICSPVVGRKNRGLEKFKVSELGIPLGRSLDT